MTRPSDDIERLVDSAAKALTALQDLAADLDTLEDIATYLSLLVELVRLRERKNQ